MKNFKLLVGVLLLATLVAGAASCSKDETSEVTSSSTSLKSAILNEVDSVMFIRDPSGTTVGAYKMYGVSLRGDSIHTFTNSISTGSNLGYQLYFYNEKVYTSNTQPVDSATGCPALFLGYNITGYKTSFTGSSVIDTLTYSNVSGTLISDASATLPLASGSPYRYASSRLIRSYVKTTYYPSFLIGNTFQGLASSAQPIYVIKSGTYYYAFMVSRFQNGSTQTGVPSTDKRYITIKYKRIK